MFEILENILESFPYRHKLSFCARFRDDGIIRYSDTLDAIHELNKQRDSHRGSRSHGYIQEIRQKQWCWTVVVLSGMNREEDRRRYLVVGSVVIEIIAPVFRKRLEKDYQNRGFGILQAFIDSQPVKHALFHLRYKNVWCCTDQPNCVNNFALPLTYNDWELLFIKKSPPVCRKLCHCNYTSKPAQLDDLDITLASLILLNCCNLRSGEEQIIKFLRQFKNNYLSHNAKGSITQDEYDTVWADLQSYVLQLDNTKEDDLIRLQNRPLDESLCRKYTTMLLDIYKRLEEMIKAIQENRTALQVNNTLLNGHHDLLQENNTLLTRSHTLTQENNTLLTSGHSLTQENSLLLQGINSSMQECLHYAKLGYQWSILNQQPDDNKAYKLGQTLFYLYSQTGLSTVLSRPAIRGITDGVMIDDGRLVLCLSDIPGLLICNAGMSKVDLIQLKYIPWNVTAVNNSTVAVTLDRSKWIEMYDINNKHITLSIPAPGTLCGITTINNTLVVSGSFCLYIIDYQTGEKIQTIHTGDCIPFHLHASSDRIFHSAENPYNNLYCYNYFKQTFSTTQLPSRPWRMTSLEDGSLCVICVDGSVQHVSSDGKHCTPVETESYEPLKMCNVLGYNSKQRKLITVDGDTGLINIYTRT